ESCSSTIAIHDRQLRMGSFNVEETGTANRPLSSAVPRLAAMRQSSAESPLVKGQSLELGVSSRGMFLPIRLLLAILLKSCVQFMLRNQNKSPPNLQFPATFLSWICPDSMRSCEMN